jgi:thiamine-phosphate pyrophosphorylase
MIGLVTDRRRLRGGDLAGQVRDAVDLGIDLIHVRERDLEAGPLAALVAALLAITKGTSTRLVVNDRLDVALACGADGVQLRGDSIPTAAARRLAPAGFLIGRSVHRVSEAIAAADADYLVAGTVFPSASKTAGTPLLGVEGLRAIVRAVDRPVLAIGGVSQARIGEVADAGAAGFAAIGLFLPADRDAEAAGDRLAELRQIVRGARARFDRLNSTP